MYYFVLIQILLQLRLFGSVNSSETDLGNERELLDNVLNLEDKQNLLLTAPIYAKIFQERRKEQVLMIKQMLKSPYEKNYKLLTMAYTNIFAVINKNNLTLKLDSYNVTERGFPSTHALQEAVTSTLENCCLAAENVLHFPEISYRIFRLTKDLAWKEVLNWCISFVNALPHVIDESTVTLIDLLRQEINIGLRNENYKNPYYKEPAQTQEARKPKTKQRKKLKKGPYLSGGNDEL